MKDALIIVVTAATLLIVSCKKDKTAATPQPAPQHENIAPCEATETTYDSSAVYFGGSAIYLRRNSE